MDTIEKVARAIAKVNEDGGSDLLHHSYEKDSEGYRELAQAAIEAMREPSPDMIDAAAKEWVEDYRYRLDTINNLWGAAIHAALAGKSTA